MKSKIVDIHGKGQEVFYTNSDSEFENQINEIYKLHNYGLFHRPKDGIYMDIGANVGMASMYFQRDAKQIYSLEPNPVLYEALVKNTSKYSNIKTFNVGIGFANEEATMFADNDDSPPQTLFENIRTEDPQTQVVTLKRLDTFMEENQIPYVNVLKIDVEGAEYAILPSSGFANVANRIDMIVGEAHYNDYGCFAECIPEILKEYGFETSFVKFPVPNFYRTFHYTEPGREKRYEVPMDTIFYARKTVGKMLKLNPQSDTIGVGI